MIRPVNLPEVLTCRDVSPKATKYVFTWGAGKADGNGSMKPLLVCKGANLAEMAGIGLPVPPGFTMTTEVCAYYYDNKRSYPAVLDAQIKAGIANIEDIHGYGGGKYKRNPFASIDITGVGQLMEIAVTKGRQTRPNLELGICGEHGGDPDSVKFCHMLGLDYVSCSPYRVPIARLAAAQAAIEDKRKQGIA